MHQWGVLTDSPLIIVRVYIYEKKLESRFTHLCPLWLLQ